MATLRAVSDELEELHLAMDLRIEPGALRGGSEQPSEATHRGR
jgi:hypothetical protein